MRTIAQLALSLALLTGTAAASWVDFEPIESSSPDGALRVTAQFDGVTDWKNTAKTVPANGNMRYQMTDAKSNGLWLVDIPIDAGFSSFDTPAELFVSTSAWTVARTHSSELLCFDPKGKQRARLDILKTLLPDQYSSDDVFTWTTAGRKWGQWYAHYYFFRHLAYDYFVIRTYWDDRLVVRMADGLPITPDAEFSTALRAAETEFVTRTLKDAMQRKDLQHASPETIRPLVTATLMAGRMGLKETAPLLRRMENVEYSRGWRSSSSRYKPAAGSIDPGFRSDLLLRQVVHLSLRRLGEGPDVFPCVHPVVEGTDPPKWAELPELAVPRDDGARELQPGMSPESVVGLLGGPDFIGLHAEWEYDIDAHVPYTLAITWGEQGVETITITRPAVWQQKDKRDLQILE